MQSGLPVRWACSSNAARTALSACVMAEAGIEGAVRPFERRTGIEAALRIGEEHLALPAGVPLVAYRTAQEALTNVARHSQATEVRVTLMRHGETLRLVVTDSDGRRGDRRRGSSWRDATGSPSTTSWRVLASSSTRCRMSSATFWAVCVMLCSGGERRMKSGIAVLKYSP